MTIKTAFTSIFLLSFIFQVVSQNKKLLIKNVTVIPLHINKILKNKDVVLINGVIKEIKNHIEKDSTNYDLGIIDGNGKYLIPAFADAHSHLPEKKNLKRFFLMNLLNGVTTLRSMRGKMWHLEINKKDEFTPKLILSSPPTSRNDTISEIDANKIVSNYKKAGFDFMKILSIKDEQTLAYLMASAKSNNFHLAGHCPSNIDVFKICQSNVYQSIEHLSGFFKLKNATDINLATNLSIINNVYHSPTLDWYFTRQVPEKELRQRPGVKFLPTELVENWEEKIATHHKNTTKKERKTDRKKSKNKFNDRLKYLKQIYEQGGKLLVSPDASGIYNIPGFGVHTEMKHYVNAGISNFDILKATCYNLSEMLSSQNEWGAIKIGAKSDMVLLNSNPLESIEDTKEINGIVFNGKFYSKSKLEEKLNSEK